MGAVNPRTQGTLWQLCWPQENVGGHCSRAWQNSFEQGHGLSRRSSRWLEMPEQPFPPRLLHGLLDTPRCSRTVFPVGVFGP